MGERITLELPNELAQNARGVAAWTHRRIEDVLLEWLSWAAAAVPVDQLPDDQVLALAEAQVSDEQQVELSNLLARQRELDGPGRSRLNDLMNIYRRETVRKAQALQVAVARGLHPALA